LGMFSAQGSLAETCSVFSEMSARSTAAWNIIIARYARERLQTSMIFHLMNREGFLPDDSTFLSVLPRKSPEECGKILALMVESFNIEPRLEHYACLADSLRYAGDAKDAQEVLRRYQVR
ncbi:hypothetical protein SELMODRAFT_72194, partial [Selaginella moellendorffii]